MEHLKRKRRRYGPYGGLIRPGRPVGRPTLPGPKRRDVKLYLPQLAIERLRDLGGGSASGGVLLLLARHGQRRM